MIWNWQQQDWPDFSWNPALLQKAEAPVKGEPESAPRSRMAFTFGLSESPEVLECPDAPLGLGCEPST
jgi:hypothetical protein